MVDTGQFLERMTVIPAAGGAVTLEALYHRGQGSPPVVLVPGHPALGGVMDGPVVSELVWALARRGHPTLRFNFRGVGASTGEPAIPTADVEALIADLSDEALAPFVDDLASAVQQQRETCSRGRVHVVGYSFGAVVALSYLQQRVPVAGAVLISPPAAALRSGESTAPVRVFRGGDDALCPSTTLEERFGQGAVISIPGADHVYARGLSQLGDAVGRALESPDT